MLDNYVGFPDGSVQLKNNIKIPINNIDTDQIKNGAITSPKILNGAITKEKLADDVIPETKIYKNCFLSALPETDIDVDTIYHIRNNSLFPSCTTIITENKYCCVVGIENGTNEYKALVFNTVTNGKGVNYTNTTSFRYTSTYGSLANLPYKVYKIVNNNWVLENEYTDTNYLTIPFGTDWKKQIVYSNYNLIAGRDFGETTQYETRSNQTDIYGIPTTGEIVLIFNDYVYKDEQWITIGISDYTELFNGFVKMITLTNALSTKIDTSAIKQTTGTSTTDIMSQKAITDLINTTE